MVKDIKDYMKDITEDRDKALTYTKLCPHCGTKQVQLVSYSFDGSDWKCRHCKQEWRIDYDKA